ncbi:hypothetical protein [Corynebacterium diphtheriae]|uniref:hypothetical protein n=1 Tax=Corynebacterium diphtheriae TaxID=1717 RepID=UPI00069742F5|nr:hypothetical protein [Corynebacterium diphtheriae]
MTKITGKLETITSTPSAVREVWLRPPSTRPSTTGLIVDEPVRVIVDESGEFTADIAPGAGVLLLVGPAGMTREAIPLLVREGTRTLRQAVEDAKDFAPDVHDRLAELANETAENLEAARGVRADTDSAVQKMHEAVQKAGVSAEGAAQSEKTAGEHASIAEGHAGDAGAAQRAAELARDKALVSEQAAGEHVKAAAQSVEQAAIHEQGAMAARSGVTDALNGAKEARTGAEKARDEARRAAEFATVGIKPDSVQKSMLSVDLRGEIDAKADLSAVDEKIRAIPKPVNTWAELQGKPSQFPPEAHKHSVSDIKGLEDFSEKKISSSADADTIVQRDEYGGVQVATDPVKFTSATSKRYVDGEISKLKLANSTLAKGHLEQKNLIEQNQRDIELLRQSGGMGGEKADTNATASTVAKRWTDGTLKVADPTIPTHAATKKYVDSTIRNTGVFKALNDVTALRSEVAALRTQIPAKRIEVVSKLPSSQDPNVIYFEEA